MARMEPTMFGLQAAAVGLWRGGLSAVSPATRCGTDEGVRKRVGESLYIGQGVSNKTTAGATCAERGTGVQLDTSCQEEQDFPSKK